MECRECGKPVTERRISVWGTFCSDLCRDAFHDRRRRTHRELAAEPLMHGPAEFNVQDFERHALKIAVYAVQLDAVQDVPEGMRDPEILALQVKELLLRHIPDEYVAAWQEGSGWTRKSLYSFRKGVPIEVVREAMRAAEFQWNVTWFGVSSERQFLSTALGTHLAQLRAEISRTIEEHMHSTGPAASTMESIPLVDKQTFASLLEQLRRMREEWDCHQRIVVEKLSNAHNLTAREALDMLDGIEHSLRIVARRESD